MKQWSDVFVYNEGQLFWKVPYGSRKMGVPVGYLTNWGYLTVQYQYKNYMVSTIIWEMFHGPVPQDLRVDHSNQNKLDNRIENLRLLTHAENIMNQRKSHNPKSSKFKGVCWDKGHGKWRATIRLGGRNKFLGLYADETEAAEAYDAADKTRGDYSPNNIKEA
jgi:hypothetical protein